MAQRERHLLVSTVLGPIAVHGYLARRGDQSEAKDDLTWASNQVCNTAHKIAQEHDAWWLPVLLSTDLDAKAGREVQALIDHQASAQDREPLKKYQSRQEKLFFAAWIMDQETPECQKLMALH